MNGMKIPIMEIINIIVEVPGENTKTEWCEEVTDEEYYKL